MYWTIASLHTDTHQIVIEEFNLERMLNDCRIILKIKNTSKEYHLILKKSKNEEGADEIDYLYSGEVAYTPTIVAKKELSILQGKELNYLVFDFQGTRTTVNFREENSPSLETFIPIKRIKFSPEHDKILQDRISTPERRKALEIKAKQSQEDNSDQPLNPIKGSVSKQNDIFLTVSFLRVN